MTSAGKSTRCARSRDASTVLRRAPRWQCAGEAFVTHFTCAGRCGRRRRLPRLLRAAIVPRSPMDLPLGPPAHDAVWRGFDCRSSGHWRLLPRARRGTPKPFGANGWRPFCGDCRAWLRPENAEDGCQRPGPEMCEASPRTAAVKPSLKPRSVACGSVVHRPRAPPSRSPDRRDVVVAAVVAWIP